MKVTLIAMFLFFSIIACQRSDANVDMETIKIINLLKFSNTTEVKRVISTLTDQQKAGLFFPDLRRMVYFQDPSTKLCFAFMRSDDYRGGPSMASVPCEAVSQFLLNPTTPDCNR